MAKSDETFKAVQNSWDFWLSQHNISVPETIHDAVKSAFSRWLTENTDELLGRIATEIAKRTKGVQE